MLTVCTLLLRETAECQFLRKRTKRDLLYVVKQLDEALAAFITTETMLVRKDVPLSVYALFEINLPQKDDLNT